MPNHVNKGDLTDYRDNHLKKFVPYLRQYLHMCVSVVVLQKNAILLTRLILLENTVKSLNLLNLNNLLFVSIKYFLEDNFSQRCIPSTKQSESMDHFYKLLPV